MENLGGLAPNKVNNPNPTFQGFRTLGGFRSTTWKLFLFIVISYNQVRETNYRQMIKKILFVLLGALLMLLTILLVNTFQLGNSQIEAEQNQPVDRNADVMLNRFTRALQYQTISGDREDQRNVEEFYEFLDFIEAEFPLVHQRLSHTRFNDLTPVYFWEGSNPDLDPILLMGHYDVVPVDSASLDEWQHEPFSGAVEDNFIWGRGTLDNKFNVMMLLETAEHLLENDYQPERSIYMAFGHDEEVGGDDGARAVSRYFQNMDIRFHFVLDEGGLVIDGLLPIERPMAIIGVAEKGYLSLELVAQSSGGHSSTPPKDKAIIKLSEALIKLEENPFPARIDGATEQMFDAIGNNLPFGLQMMYANRWLTEGMLKNRLSGDRSTSALIRTTIAPTILRAGVKDNVLPTEARAVVNFRILPGDTFESVTDHVRNVIGDESITIREYETISTRPSTVSRVDGSVYQALQESIMSHFQDVYIAPYLVVGATDSRHFIPVADNVYRFSPIEMSNEDLDIIHGINERIGVDSYLNSIRFYVNFIQKTTQ